ncbi:MAG: adenosylcobinamide-GDP ribazoletransferase [Geminicoccaceae bacterium]
MVDDLRLAFALLTRLPVGRRAITGVPAAAVWAFPLVGGILGLAAGLAALLLALILAERVAVVLAMLLLLLATGALHEDGLADVADGFGGGGDRERRLAIMRDSRIGSYGMLALAVAMLLRLECLSALAGSGLAFVWMAAGACGGAAMAGMLAITPAARGDGLGSSVAGPGRARVVAALILAILLAAVAGPAGLAMLPAAFIATLAMRWLAMRQIGGFTGDVLGATKIAAELAGLLAATAVLIRP